MLKVSETSSQVAVGLIMSKTKKNKSYNWKQRKHNIHNRATKRPGEAPPMDLELTHYQQWVPQLEKTVKKFWASGIASKRRKKIPAFFLLPIATTLPGSFVRLSDS